jgi:lysophospholipase L1-like esterase
MTTYTLTVSTDALGLGVIEGARVLVDRKRTQVTDIFNGQSISKNNVATNSLGIATIPLEPDDGSVYHELKIFDLAGILVYSKIFIMPPQAVAVTALPVQDIISSSAAQAVAASVTATAQAVISTAQASTSTAQAVISTAQAVIATTQAGTATTQAGIATDKAVLTAADRVQTGFDVIATESARDAALIQAGVYTTEEIGRAAVADGQAFKVQGSGDVAAYEYRRTNSTTSVLIATYPSVGAVWAIDSLKRNASIGKNRFNPTDRNVVAGSAINNATGATVVTAGFNATGYIPVAASTAYIMSVGRNYAWYDSGRNYISGGTGTGVAQSVTSPVNTAYFRCGISDATLSTFQFELGTSSTLFAAYTEEPALQPDVVTTSALRRLSVTPARASFISAGKNKFDLSVVTVGQYITAAGVFAANATYDTSDYIEVVAGTAYKSSHNIRFSCYFDAAMNVVAGGLAVDSTAFTVPSGVAFVRLSMYHANLSAFQLETGATATAYESFRWVNELTSPVADGSINSTALAASAITPSKTDFLQLGKNKFNKAAVTIGYYVTNANVTAANATYDASAYIAVVAGTAYKSSHNIRFSCYYDANYAVVSGGTAADITTFTPPTGAAYIRVTMYHADINVFQLEVGATATTYESYRYNFLDSAGVPIILTLADGQVVEAKLGDLAVATSKLAIAAVTPEKTNFLQLGKNKFNKAAVTTGYYITNTGSILANATYDISDYIPVVAGTAYVCNGSGIRFSCYFDANYAVVAGGTSTTITTFTPPVGAVYVRVTMFHVDLASFQLEIGATATAYAYYQYSMSLASGVPITITASLVAPVLVMPPTIYGVQGRECNLYIDNLHLGDSTLFNHDVTNTAVNGAQQRERWTWTPTGVQSTGTLTVSAYDKTQGMVLASATTNQRAAASTAGSGTTKTINVIGDSLINAAVITQTVIDIAATDVMGVSFIGTRGTAPNKHEGRGGWSINDYSTAGRTFYSFTVSGVVTSPLINSTVYTNNGSTFKVQELSLVAGSGTIICERTAGTNAPSASGTLTKSSGTGDATIAFSSSSAVSGNPFWISGALNYAQYLTNNSLATPDWVVIHLGINDAFSYTTDEAVIAAAVAAFTNLDLLITSIKAAGAGVKVGLMIPTPPASQDGFAAAYGAGQTAWRDKRNIMLWAKTLIERYTGQEASRIYLVPTNTALDVVNGYTLATSAPVNSRSSVMIQRQSNGVHPDTGGYQQIGDALWAFLKCNA